MILQGDQAQVTYLLQGETFEELGQRIDEIVRDVDIQREHLNELQYGMEFAALRAPDGTLLQMQYTPQVSLGVARGQFQGKSHQNKILKKDGEKGAPNDSR